MYFFLFVAHLWLFGVLGLGSWIGCLGLVFAVDGVFGIGTVVWGLLGFLGLGLSI